MTSRTFRTALAALSVFGFIAGLIVAWHARFVAPYRARVVHIVVQLPRQHRSLAGLTIGFVTDIHVGPHFSAADLEPVVNRLEAIRPDLVLLGGDYVCESPRFMRQTAPLLGRIASTAKYGAYGVLGNHDLANLRDRIVPALEKVGISILANESACVETDRGNLWIAGIDDGLLGKVDLVRAFAGIPADAATVCLWHEPDRVEESAPFGAFLQLSGHSHGGQVRLPGIGAIATPKLGKRFVHGRFQVGDMELYVSSGVGVYRPPVRLNCPPELTVIKLID